MTSIGTLTYDITANSAGLDAALAESEAKTKGFGEATGSAVALAGAAIIAAGIGIAGIAVKMAADFQTATTQLVTGAGESQQAIEGIRQGLLDMAGQVGQTPTELAKGLYMISSAGYTGAQGLDILKAAAEGAVVGASDLETTSNAVTTVMKDYARQNISAGDATNFLVGVVSLGKTHMEDLAGAMAKVLPTASALHVPLADVGGAMATLTAHGVDAAKAATTLNTTIANMAAETPKGQKALESIGLNAKELSDVLTTKGLVPALQLVNQHLDKTFGNDTAAKLGVLKDMTGGVRGLGASLGLTGQNLQEFVNNTQAVTDKIKSAHGSVLGWDQAQKDLGQRWKEFTDGLASDLIRLGNYLNPFVTQVVGWFTEALPRAMQATVDWWSKNSQAIGTFVSQVASFVGGVALQLIDALGKIGHWLGENRGFFLAIAEVVGGALIGAIKILADVFGFFGDHMAIFGPILEVVVIGFVALKAAMLIQALVTGVSDAFSVLALVLGGQVTAAEGVAALGAEKLGSAIFTMTTGIGAAVAVIGVIVFSILSAAAATQKWKDDQAKFAEEGKKALANVTQGWASLSTQALTSGEVIATVQKAQILATDGSYAAFLKLMQAQKAGSNDWINSLDQTNLHIVGMIAQFPDAVQFTNQFKDALKQAGGDGELALEKIARGGSSAAAEALKLKQAIDALNTSDLLSQAQAAFSVYVQAEKGDVDKALADLHRLNPGYVDLINQNNALAQAINLPKDQWSQLGSVGTINMGNLHGKSAELIAQMNGIAPSINGGYLAVLNLAQQGGDHIVQLADGKVVHLTSNMSDWQGEIVAAEGKAKDLKLAIEGIPENKQVAINMVVKGFAAVQAALAQVPFLPHAAEGLKVRGATSVIMGEGRGGEIEWSIPEHKAGPFAPLLDALVGIGGSSLPMIGSGVASSGSSTGQSAQPVSVSVNMSGILARSQSEFRSIAMTMMDAVNQQLTAQGLAPLPTRQVAL